MPHDDPAPGSSRHEHPRFAKAAKAPTPVCLACTVADAGGPGRTGLGQARQVIASIAVSAFGTWAYNVGIAVYAYERTHSAGWVAAVTVGRYIPALVLSWLGGRLLDRLPRRGLAVAADLLCAAVMLLLAALGAAAAPLWVSNVR